MICVAAPFSSGTGGRLGREIAILYLLSYNARARGELPSRRKTMQFPGSG